jgi:diguanylate cyclase (GGDEF)-like protein/PAS domain S-box-containing protein
MRTGIMRKRQNLIARLREFGASAAQFIAKAHLSRCLWTPLEDEVSHAALAAMQAQARAAEDRAQKAHDQLRAAIDALPEGIVFLDEEGRYILWNESYAEIYKASADLFRPGARLADTLRIGVARGNYPDAIGREEEWISQRLALLTNPGQRHEQRLADGRWIMIDERRTRDGGTIGIRVDITELKQREASFRLLFESNPIPMYVYDAETLQFKAVNAAALRHYGYSLQQFLGMTIEDISCGKHKPEVGGDAEADMMSGTCHHRKADASLIDVAIFSRRLTYEGTACVIVSAVDITERNRAEARVAHMALHDALTGLPNRLLYRERVENELTRERGADFALLLLDLDEFKGVNDSLGHPMGDRLLEIVAERIAHCTRASDLVARLGGDEFAVLHTGSTQMQDVAAVAQRIIASVSQPYDLDGHHVRIGASIGIAIAPHDGNDADKLLRAADLALYSVKAEGKGAFRFFEPVMDAQLQARRALELDLRQALFNGDLAVYYQPLVHLQSGEIQGFEALLRWFSPKRGFVAPVEFIPLAEEAGLIGEIGEFVLQRACHDAIGWPAHTKVAVNLSPNQLKNAKFLDTVKAALESSGLPPARLELEITESLLMTPNESTVSTLYALRSLGVGISMDDFGTGYSSLSYLRSFPFSKIKIDKSFVGGLSDNSESQAIVRAIVGLGASLGITVTAEGIEEQADLDHLQQEGCNEGQGFYFSRALPPQEILKMFEQCDAA